MKEFKTVIENVKTMWKSCTANVNKFAQKLNVKTCENVSKIKI